MNFAQAEGLLAVLYAACAALSVTSVTSLVVAWQYWARTLNTCISVDCGCILYGINTFSTFMGGDVNLCHFATYGPVPAIAIGLLFSVYHGYRCCIDRGLDQPRTADGPPVYNGNRNSLNGKVIVVGPKRRSPCKQWMPAAFCAALICCLSLAHAVVATDGYYKTCEQYKRNLIQLLGSRGREVQVIRQRLPCNAILDFMDYLQPDANNWRRGDEINTGLTLQLAIVSTWLNCLSWLVICVVNFVMARRRLNNLGERFCCW